MVDGSGRTGERIRSGVAVAIAAIAAATAAACGGNATAQAGGTPPPEVSVITVAHETVPIRREYPARTYARDMVEVRGRVDGYIESRAFTIGANVRAGQVLYVLDRRPYEAEVERMRGALAQVTADLAQAEANLVKAEQDVRRLEPLVKEEAAARQDLDNALAALRASRAAVNARQAGIAAARAQVRTAELNLEYATIRAPIAGRVGDSLLQVGGLVSRTAADPLTTIVPLDPIWVRFQVGEAELLQFQRLDPRTLPIELLLQDGRVHPGKGRIENTLNGVNVRTATLELQARFDNPGQTLLPGQFGRVRIRVVERQDAVLVPQKAVQELQGMHTAMVVGRDGTVSARTIVATDRIGDRWLVEQGLEPGESVVVEGLQKAPAGARVRTVPYQPPAARAGSLVNDSGEAAR